jgi:uncharacterized membrane protein YbhN (UPF0104 family)
MKRLYTNLLFLVAIIAIIVMILAFDVSFTELWGYITRAGYWMIAILVLWLGLYCMNTLAWRTILKGSGPCNIGFWRLFQLTASGYALNSATSIGLVSGEPYRVLELSRYVGTQRATSSVVLFVMMHIYSHFWFWLTSIATFLVLALVGDVKLTGALALVLTLATVLCVAGIYLFLVGYRKGMIAAFIHLVARVPGLRKWGQRFESNHADDLKRIDMQIAQLRGQKRKNFLQSFFLEYVGRLLQSLEVFFILLILGIDGGGTLGGLLLTLLHSFLILAFTSLFANLLGFIPLQLGGREGGFALSVVGLGMTAEVGIFISILCRVRELFYDCVGVVLMKLHRD